MAWDPSTNRFEILFRSIRTRIRKILDVVAILLFVFVPLADLILLMVMSSYTGWQFSVGLVIVSGIVGAYLAKQSYKSVWKKIGQRAAVNQMPTDLLTDGAMIFFAAGLLLTPGFITDAVGFTLLIPVCRRWYKTRIAAWFKRNVKFEVVQMKQQFGSDVVDGEVLHPENDSTQDSGDPRLEVEQTEGGF